MMDKEKQIIEIKECIDAVYGADCAYYDVDGFAIANEIYNAGYRKQSEDVTDINVGNKTEWISHEGYEECGLCHRKAIYQHNFCPNCGAKMRKEDESNGI